MARIFDLLSRAGARLRVEASAELDRLQAGPARRRHLEDVRAGRARVHFSGRTEGIDHQAELSGYSAAVEQLPAGLKAEWEAALAQAEKVVEEKPSLKEGLSDVQTQLQTRRAARGLLSPNARDDFDAAFERVNGFKVGSPPSSVIDTITPGKETGLSR